MRLFFKCQTVLGIRRQHRHVRSSRVTEGLALSASPPRGAIGVIKARPDGILCQIIEGPPGAGKLHATVLPAPASGQSSDAGMSRTDLI